MWSLGSHPQPARNGSSVCGHHHDSGVKALLYLARSLWRVRECSCTLPSAECVG
jgi:hypothetical protein